MSDPRPHYLNASASRSVYATATFCGLLPGVMDKLLCPTA